METTQLNQADAKQLVGRIMSAADSRFDYVDGEYDGWHNRPAARPDNVAYMDGWIDGRNRRSVH